MYRYQRWTIVFAILQANGFVSGIDRMLYGEWSGKGGDKLTQTLNSVALVISLALFAWGLRRARKITTGGIISIILAIFLCASSIWSIDPETSLRRGIIYLFFIMSAIGIAGLCDGDQFMDLLVLACGIATIASLILFAVSPGTALMHEETFMFRGMYAHKNVVGQVMAVGALASLHAIRSGRRRLLNFVWLIMFCAITALSTSATALLTIVFFCGISSVSALLRKGGAARMLGIMVIFLLVPVVLVIATAPDLILEAAGKDPTLTGRTDLWPYVLDNIAERPILGWGLSAFWEQSNPAADAISTALGWVVPQAHNGILEMMLSVGAVGTAFFVFLWVRNVVVGIQCLFGPAYEIGLSLVLCCSGLFLIGTTEEVFVDSSQASVIVFFVAGFICEQASLARRRDKRLP